ncbi:Asp-tRNA(Asn)/Glu-tRNA(Gln) amidotransferase subunit GatA [candidate division TA06 bacterium]|uniref:Glutamyl-tRNA(Gln) amidotransferase subunit A n=1 Tax=candidate division TA06 bacterium TaxID=2250710 RepID=A0A523XPJ2_UNCT6|nr:MAG: Asp-tRNA(Asn)/Glu-tRNA(Gln) amidotransferase subunit GatA [candidate division TA06 bacterium]
MIFEKSCRELSELLRKGEVSSVSLVHEALARIKSIDLNSFITICENEALEAAEEADRLLRSKKKLSPLCGIPIGLKDNLVTKGVETTCGSKILKGFIPPFDATVVERLKQAGMVIVGKTNMDEFGMGSSTENSHFGPVRNPWDRERVPGGSSGGSAAAVASRQVPLALGSDTGGSIRQPASFCGTVGLKPTYGRVSRYGLVAFASSLDQICPMANSVEDCAFLLEAMAGEDARDSTSVPVAVPHYPELIGENVKGMKIGVPKEFFGKGLDEEVKKSVDGATHLLEELGAQTIEVSLPHTDYAIATYYLIANAEASSNLARYDGVRYGHRTENFPDLSAMYSKTRDEGVGDEVKSRIMLGTYALSAGYYDAYYLRALKVRTLIKSDFDKALESVDCLVTPTSPTVSFKIGEKIDDPLSMYLSDVYTVSVSLAGLPAVSMPCGFSASGLPIGMQIIGKAFDESTILRVAKAFESSSNSTGKIPPAAEADIGV